MEAGILKSLMQFTDGEEHRFEYDFSNDEYPLLKEKYMGNFVYIMKNMVYTEYCAAYGVGETKPIYLLFPENLETEYEYLIDLSAVECAPM